MKRSINYQALGIDKPSITRIQNKVIKLSSRETIKIETKKFTKHQGNW